MVFVPCSIAAVAQEREYRPFCEEGKVWISQLVSAIDTSYVFSTKIEVLAGDTIIDGKPCIKLYHYSPNNYPQMKNPYYKGAFYEDQGRVYYYHSGSQHPVLKYDFKTPKGEHIDIDDTPVVVVQDGFTIDKHHLLEREVEFVMTEYRKEMLELYPDRWDMLKCGLWREGVGNLYGPPYDSIYDKFEPTGLTSTLLISCSLGNDFLFLRPGYEDLIDYITDIYSPKYSIQTYPAYDTSGRIITSPHSHGINIIDGKKTIR